MVDEGGKRSFWSSLRDSLAIPELRHIDLDSPEMTALRRDAILNNPTKRYAFDLWYRVLAQTVSSVPEGKKVELGAGGGYLDQFIPGLIRTDVVELPFLDGICRAEEMPYANGELSALLMINVLHHIPDVRAFLREAVRTLKSNGRIAMIEPTVTPASRFVYRYLHHEPFDTKAEKWELPPAGRLSGGNDALPWIIFYRDLMQFSREFPQLRVVKRVQFDCLVHLLSGGVTTRNLVPMAALKGLRLLENAVPFVPGMAALFQLVVLEKTDA